MLLYGLCGSRHVRLGALSWSVWLPGFLAEAVFVCWCSFALQRVCLFRTSCFQNSRRGASYCGHAHICCWVTMLFVRSLHEDCGILDFLDLSGGKVHDMKAKAKALTQACLALSGSLQHVLLLCCHGLAAQATGASDMRMAVPSAALATPQESVGPMCGHCRRCLTLCSPPRWAPDSHTQSGKHSRCRRLPASAGSPQTVRMLALAQ